MSIELTKKQQLGLELAVDRFNRGEKYTVIAGYAGTGKSTLVHFIIDALHIPEDSVCYATFTGKAAEVLRKKGNKNAMTLHRLLYNNIPKPDGTFYRRPKENLDYDLVVIDEISMVPGKFIELLFSYNCHVICLGDPYQLPPIDKNDANTLLDNPHIFLDEIMRQEAESEIIQLTMKIRNGEPIEPFDGKDIKVIRKSELNTGMLQWADEIITSTNATRAIINRQVRELNGFSGPLQSGEKVICLKNYWDDTSINGDALVNGLTGITEQCWDSYISLPYFVTKPIRHFETKRFNLRVDNDVFKNIECDKSLIETGRKCCDNKLAWKLGKYKTKYGNLVPREFDFGYAITCHKAQGSEWDKVLVIEEKFPFPKEEHNRWLYTACTRASEKLVLVR